MRKWGGLLFLIFALGCFSAFGQSSCECQSEGCSATQTCPSGYLAQCTCGRYCSSQCVKAGEELPELDFATGGRSLTEALAGSNEKNISREFSKSLGKRVVFTKGSDSQRLTVARPAFESYWQVAEFLAANGKLTINGLPFEIWKGHRDTLLKGGEYSICASDVPAKIILNEINFLTERSFEIVKGDPRSTAKAVISGTNLKDVLRSLSDSRNITIR